MQRSHTDKGKKTLESSLDLSHNYSFRFPTENYFKEHSIYEQPSLTDDPHSKSDESDYDSKSKRSGKSKRKNKKPAKNKQSTKVPASKAKKENSKELKLEPFNSHAEPTLSRLRQSCPFGIETSQPINEQKFIEVTKNQGKGKNPRKTKNQVIKMQRTEPVTESQEAEQQQKNLIIKDYDKQELEYLTSLCEFHVIDFKYHHRENFNIEKDLMFVLVPKRFKSESKQSEVPQQIILRGEQVCENGQIFNEILMFYKNLSISMGLTKA